MNYRMFVPKTVVQPADFPSRSNEAEQNLIEVDREPVS